MDLIFCVNGLLGIDGTVSPKTSETTKALCRICFRIRAWASDHPKHDRFGDLLCRNVMFVELTSGFLLFKRKNTRKSVKTVQNKRNLLDR